MLLIASLVVIFCSLSSASPIETVSYNYQVNVTFQPVYSPDTFGKLSLLVESTNGDKINVTLSEKDEWMKIFQTNTYNVELPFYINQIKNISSSFSSNSDGYEVIRFGLALKLDLLMNATLPLPVRKFYSGILYPHRREELYEEKDTQDILFQDLWESRETNLEADEEQKMQVEVFYLPVYASPSFGKLSLLLIPENEAEAVNVSLCQQDEKLGFQKTTYNVQTKLNLDKVKSVAVSWSTPNHENYPSMQHIKVEITLKQNGQRVRKFRSSLVFADSRKIMREVDQKMQMYTLDKKDHEYQLNIYFVKTDWVCTGKLSLLIISENEGDAVNVTVSKEDESFDKQLNFNFKSKLSNDEIKRMAVNWSTNMPPRAKDELRFIYVGVKLIEVGSEEPSRFFTSSQLPSDTFEFMDE